MGKISDILAHKNERVLTISQFGSAFDAISGMINRKVGSIVVAGDHNDVLGIFTERDYLRRVVMENRPPHQTFMSEVMTKNPLCASINQLADDCLQVMCWKQIQYMPVLDRRWFNPIHHWSIFPKIFASRPLSRAIFPSSYFHLVS